ncbi:phage recombination protein Bet [Actinomycetospora corticicola]
MQDCNDADITAFLHLCQRTGLDPWARQIYLINRREKVPGTRDQYRDKWQPQTGIDGFRVIAQRHGDIYRGQTAPEWCGDDGVWMPVWLKKGTPPAASRVGVLRSDRDEPVWGIAVFSEFAQYTSGGDLNAMWKTKSSHMIAKCAEAAALRKAFPQDMAGLTIAEEVGANRPTRVESTRVTPSGPVDNSELTGKPAPKDTPKKSDAPKASAVKAAGDSMTPEQQRTFLRLRREADVGDAKAYASQHLGRTINSLGELTQGDAAKLIENLEAMLGADEPGQPEVIDAEVVDEGQATTEQPAAQQ